MTDTLDITIPNRADYELARRHAPHIRFDAREPFLPSIVGYTVFRENGLSSSFPREVVLPPGTASAVEYAIWWDWEIEHLYELEHIWVYFNADEKPLGAEASWHGGFAMMDDADGLSIESDRLTLYSEPGKHAFAPSPKRLLERTESTRRSCVKQAGCAGVLITPLFEGIIHSRNPLVNRAVHTFLECQAFEPSFEFTQVFDLERAIFVPWSALFEYIPLRVAELVSVVRQTVPVNQQHLYKIAHRGASAYAPENSLEAFRKAAEMDADLVEVDIRVTADGIPIVSHDNSLKRVFGVEGVIAERTLEELRALTPRGVAPLPTFDEVALTCADLGLGLYLDIKDFNADLGARVIASLKRTELLDQCIAGSFDLDTVAELKAAEPRLMTSILFSSVQVDPVALAHALHADYVHPCWERRAPQPHTLLTPEWIAYVHASGLGIVCWHEERPDEIAALRALGVDAICSDTPDRLAVHRVVCP